LNDKTPAHQYIFNGFTQVQGFRRFAFEGIGADQARTQFAVDADLALIRVYGIRIQDLPLLCRELLERRADSEAAHRVTFTEEDMRLHKVNRQAAQEAAGQKRKPPQRPPTGNVGNAWRIGAGSPAAQ